MLVLSRRLDEAIIIPDAGIQITVLSVQGNRVRLGIDAPATVEIRRCELPIGTSGKQLENGLENSGRLPADSATD